MEPMRGVAPTAGLHQGDRAHTVARHMVAGRMVDPRRPTAVHEVRLIVAALTLARHPRTEAGLLVTVAELMAVQRLPMVEADQLLLTAGAAVPAVLAEAVGMHHLEAEGIAVAEEAVTAVEAEATAAADTAKPTTITKSRPSGRLFYCPGKSILFGALVIGVKLTEGEAQ